MRSKVVCLCVRALSQSQQGRMQHQRPVKGDRSQMSKPPSVVRAHLVVLPESTAASVTTTTQQLNRLGAVARFSSHLSQAVRAHLVVLPELLADAKEVGFHLLLSIVQRVTEHAALDRQVVYLERLQACTVSAPAQRAMPFPGQNGRRCMTCSGHDRQGAAALRQQRAACELSQHVGGATLYRECCNLQPMMTTVAPVKFVLRQRPVKCGNRKVLANRSRVPDNLRISGAVHGHIAEHCVRVVCPTPAVLGYRSTGNVWKTTPKQCPGI